MLRQVFCAHACRKNETFCGTMPEDASCKMVVRKPMRATGEPRRISSSTRNVRRWRGMVEQSLRRLLPRIKCNAFLLPSSFLVRDRAGCQSFEHELLQRFGIGGAKIRSSIAARLHNRISRRGDDRATEDHGFERRHAEALVERG